MGTELWIIELVVVAGLAIGHYLATMLPYWKERRKLEKEGVNLKFDDQFLQTAILSGIGTLVFVGTIFPVALANVDPTASITVTFLAAFTTAFTGNTLVNKSVGTGKITEEAKEQALQNKLLRLQQKGE